MGGYLPDGITQAMIDRHLDGGMRPCARCKQDPCECCSTCGAGPDQACEPWCGFPNDEDPELSHDYLDAPVDEELC